MFTNITITWLDHEEKPLLIINREEILSKVEKIHTSIDQSSEPIFNIRFFKEHNSLNGLQVKAYSIPKYHPQSLTL